MTYKDLLQQLQQLSEEQLNKDVCVYDSENQDEYYHNVELVFATDNCESLEVDYPIIRY
jgi:hypothetical protein